VKAHVHAELLARVLEQRRQRARVRQLRRCLEMHPHEEEPRGILAFEVAELLRIDDVAAGLVEQARHRMHDALGVAAREGEDELVVQQHDRRL